MIGRETRACALLSVRVFRRRRGKKSVADFRKKQTRRKSVVSGRARGRLANLCPVAETGPPPVPGRRIKVRADATCCYSTRREHDVIRACVPRKARASGLSARGKEATRASWRKRPSERQFRFSTIYNLYNALSLHLVFRSRCLLLLCLSAYCLIKVDQLRKGGKKRIVGKTMLGEAKIFRGLRSKS